VSINKIRVGFEFSQGIFSGSEMFKKSLHSSQLFMQNICHQLTVSAWITLYVTFQGQITLHKAKH